MEQLLRVSCSDEVQQAARCCKSSAMSRLGQEQGHCRRCPLPSLPYRRSRAVWLPTSVGSGKEGGSGISGILMGTWNQGCFSGFTGSGSVGGSGTSMGGSGTSGGSQPSPPPQSKLLPSCTDWQKRGQGSVASHTQQVSLRWTFERWAAGKEGDGGVHQAAHANVQAVAIQAALTRGVRPCAQACGWWDLHVSERRANKGGAQRRRRREQDRPASAAHSRLARHPCGAYAYMLRAGTLQGRASTSARGNPRGNLTRGEQEQRDAQDDLHG